MANMWRSTPKHLKGYGNHTKREQTYARRTFNSTFASSLFYKLATRFFTENF